MKFLLKEVRFLVSGLLFGLAFVPAILWLIYFKFNVYLVVTNQHYIDMFNEADCTIYLMSGGRQRVRTCNTRDEIPTLFQGRNPLKGKAIYPGDSKIFERRKLTLQIHNLCILSNDNSREYENIYAVAIRIPKEMSIDWIVQNQGGG